MMTSFLTILYEDLLIGEQVDVQTTVHEGLLRGEQADVYSHRSSMRQLLKEEESESNKEHEEGGKGGKEEDNREISCPRIDESYFLPCA